MPAGRPASTGTFPAVAVALTCPGESVGPRPGGPARAAPAHRQLALGGRAGRGGRRHRPAGRALAALAGLRAAVVWVLLDIAFFTAISGRPMDGVLILIVAAGLAWDAGRRALRHAAPGRHPDDGALEAGGAPEAGDDAVARPSRLPGGRRRLLAVAALLA